MTSNAIIAFLFIEPQEKEIVIIHRVKFDICPKIKERSEFRP